MKSIYTFSDPIRLVEGRHGYMAYNQYCHYVGRALELYGEYCEHEIELISALLKPEDVIWEIGANTGSMSVALILGWERLKISSHYLQSITINPVTLAR